MLIGIDGSRAFLKQRTGIEEYSYQVIKGLVRELSEAQVVLYLRPGQSVDFELPENWRIKVINFNYLWTQVGLSVEMFFRPVDVLFVPAHTLPWIHPQKSFVTIHGLEYEFCPEAYSAWDRFYMRLSIKNSCRWAKRIISVSKNTKQDLQNLYGVAEDKIDVIYEGYDEKSQITNHKSQINHKPQTTSYKPYLLFIGRLEERKNIVGIISAFEILKEKYKIPHKLILAGKIGYGYDKIKFQISNSKFQKDVIETGFVSEEEKWQLLKNADCFLFPTFYEGFGLPILEAQSVGVPVVTSNVSSVLEVADSSAVLVDPNEPEFIAEQITSLIVNQSLRDDMIRKGFENVKRFSWEKCAQEISEVLMGK